MALIASVDPDTEMLSADSDRRSNQDASSGANDNPTASYHTRPWSEQTSMLPDRSQSNMDVEVVYSRDSTMNPPPTESQGVDLISEEHAGVSLQRPVDHSLPTFAAVDLLNGVDTVPSNEADIPIQPVAPPSPNFNAKDIALESLDLLNKITGLYRLLDLRNDDGSSGIGEFFIWISYRMLTRFQSTRLLSTKTQSLTLPTL